MDTQDMADPMYLEDARSWLSAEVAERRKLDMLAALGLFLISALCVIAGFYYLGPFLGLGGLLVMLILHLIYSRWYADSGSVVRAATIRPRLIGVVRNPALTRQDHNQLYIWIRAGVVLLTAPFALCHEAVALLLRRRSIATLPLSEAVVRVLALLAERQHAWDVTELAEQVPNVEDALDEMQDLRGFIKLKESARITLTDTVREEIRAGANQLNATP